MTFTRFFLILTLLWSAGCSSPQSAARVTPWKSTGKLKVLTSIVPVFCFTKLVAGDDAEVLCLMTAHGPHGFTPTHDDVKVLSEADLFVVIGLGLEEFLNGMVRNADNRKLKVIRTGLEVPENRRLASDGKPHYHGDKLVSHPGTDPHVWLGMEETSQMVDGITEALVDRDAKNAEKYKARASDVKKKLAELKTRGADQLKSAKGGLITFHDSFRYFGRSFGITIAGTIRDVKGDQPLSPAALRQQADEFKKLGVRVIGVEPQFPRGIAENLAKEIDPQNTRIIELDPIETGPSLQDSPYQVNPNYYFERMELNLRNLRKAYE